MSKIEYPDKTGQTDVERTSEDILEDIAAERENISHAVDQISEIVTEKLDWREYVKSSPYVTTGVAAGIGFLASGLLQTRTTANERIVHSIAQEVHEAIGSMRARAAGAGLIKATMAGIVVKVAIGLIREAAAKKQNADMPKV